MFHLLQPRMFWLEGRETRISDKNFRNLAISFESDGYLCMSVCGASALSLCNLHISIIRIAVQKEWSY